MGSSGERVRPPAHPKNIWTDRFRPGFDIFGKRIFMPSRICSMIAILCLLTAGSVWSQDTKGTISGRVTDPSGSVIPGAQVVVTNSAMGTKSDLTTNAEGIYRAPALSPGIYQIEVVATGFKKAVRPGIEVRVADSLAVN